MNQPLSLRQFFSIPSRWVWLLAVLMTGCAIEPVTPTSSSKGAETLQCTSVAPSTCPTSPVCPVCPSKEPVKPTAAPLEPVRWEALPDWPGRVSGQAGENLATGFETLLNSCRTLQRQAVWQPVCASARALKERDNASLSSWFEKNLQPWQLVNPDGNREGLVTGYYEPVIKASRHKKKPYLYPIQSVPDDLIDVELGDLYPELKHMRLRGRIEGRKLVPYYSRAEWEKMERIEKIENGQSGKTIAWSDDALDVFFMQIQGSGQVVLDDGKRIRVGYADQNGHPYRSIGRWLIDQGELRSDQASMQGIRAWLKGHPQRMQELLDTNPSYVFFRELSVDSEGPPGAMGIPLTAERSIAVDPRFTPLGVPVWLSTNYPNSDRALTRLMVAQDTGGAIRGPVRADFFWGSGVEAGNQAGKMRQKGQMWVLLPLDYTPPALSK